MHDNLTGLPNRELFFDRLDSALAMGRVDAGVRPTVIAIDIDRFRRVNEDETGVAAGDSVLLTIARRLSRLLQPHDTLARLASDQFGIILISESEHRIDHRARRHDPPRLVDTGHVRRTRDRAFGHPRPGDF